MNDDLLYAPRAAVRRVQEANFAATLDLVFAGSPYYRTRLNDIRLRFNDIRLRRGDTGGLDDLRCIPVTTNTDLIRQPRDFLLVIPDVPIEMRMPWEVFYTTGSTGQPTPFQSNKYDFYNILTSYRRMLTIRGVGSADVLANLYPVTQYPQGAYIRVMNGRARCTFPSSRSCPSRRRRTSARAARWTRSRAPWRSAASRRRGARRGGLQTQHVYIGCDAHGPKYMSANFNQYINTHGQNKFVFGTDLPALSFDRIRREIDGLGFRAEPYRKLMRDNALQLYDVTI